MRQEATVRLHPSLILNANDRRNWRKEAEMKATLVQFGRLQLGRNMRPDTGKVHVLFEFTFPIRRARDRANLHPTCKALLDGIVRAGTVLIDDSDAHIEGPDIVITDEKGEPNVVKVRVVIEDLRAVRRARLVEAERQIMAERAEVVRAKAEYDRGRKR